MKENKHISLGNIDRKNPFKVPENYFENFAVQINAKTAPRKTTSIKRIKSWMYAAAVFAGIIVLGTVYYSNKQKEKYAYAENYESYVLSQVDESSMMDYYIDHK